MIGIKKSNPFMVLARIVKFEGSPPFVEDEKGNRWNISQVEFYYPLLSEGEGIVKHIRPFIFDNNGNLKLVGVVFPLLFRDGNVQEPVALPFGKFGLSDRFESFDGNNFDQETEIRLNDLRSITRKEDGAGNITKRFVITESGSEVGHLEIRSTRDGRIELDLESQQPGFSADINLNVSGNVSLNIKGDANIDVLGAVTIKSDDVSIGGNRQYHIPIGEELIEWLKNHTHRESTGLPTAPPILPPVESNLLSGKHTVDK